METGVIQIDFKDGRLYRVFYQNRTQKQKLYIEIDAIKDKIEMVRPISSGIHTVKEFKEHLKHI